LKRISIYYGWVIVGIAVFTMFLVYGVRHSFSVFFPSLLNEFGWKRGSTSIMLSLHIFTYGFVAPFAGLLVDRWKPRRVMVMGVTILGLASAACGLASQLWHFYLIFGILAPAGLSLCGWPILSPTISNWFSKRRGLAMGMGQAGGGLSFAYAIFAEYLISEFGWRHAYFANGGILIVVLLPIVLLFYFYHPKDKGLETYGAESTDGEAVPISKSESEDNMDWTLKYAIKTHQLWLMVLSMLFFWGIGCYMILGHQVKLAEDAGYSGMFAASIFALYGIVMVLGQLASAVSDWIGRELTVYFAFVLTIIALLALLLVKDATSPWQLYVYAICFGFGGGLYSPTVFVGAADIYHGRCFGAISGLILAGLGVGGAFGPWIGGYIYDVWGSYDFAIYASIASFVLALITFLLATPRKAAIIRRDYLKSFTD